MRLKKLELYGFKSFATRTEIIFGDGITGIVGPNGSGKSNIGDAVRWVLGEQSAKTLRGSSMSDVIFNGTQTRKPLSYCEVSLCFSNEDHALPLDYSEVLVTRRVYRNGESEYFLNQSSCRLKDIVDLFRDTGIGKEGYSIIGQGRIDEILSRKSEDRRQIFEEAAGIVKYKARKEEADKKLEHTLQNAERVDDILEELSKRIKPLEEQSKAARQYLEWSEELKKLDLNLFLVRSDRYENRISEFKNNIENLQTVINTENTHISELNQKRDHFQETIENLNSEIHNQHDSLIQLTEDVFQTEQSLALLKTRIDTRKENEKQLFIEISETEEKINNLDQLYNHSGQDINIKQKELEEAQCQLSELQDKEIQYKKEEETANQDLEQHKQLIIDDMNRSSMLQNDQTRLHTMKKQIQERLIEIQSSIDTINTDHIQLKADVEQYISNLNREKETYSKLEKDLENKQKVLDENRIKLFAVQNSAEKKSSEMQSVQSRYHLLTEMSREMEGYNNSVRHAIQYSKDHHIPGVYGALAYLIQVPQQYEIAIDMALGAAVQNIVTDNEETAKLLINYLRENKLGRATFLPISTIRSKTLSPQEKQLHYLPGFIGIASELIQYHEQFKPIIENLLGRTVIADNLDHGIKIMKEGHHSFRLVTLNGDVMHSGGSMTGGSIQSKMTNLLGREREIIQLSEVLKTGKQEFDQMKQDLENLHSKEKSIVEAIHQQTELIHQQDIAIAREQDHVSHAEERLLENKQLLENTKNAESQLLESLSDVDSQLNYISENRKNESFNQESMEEKTEILQNDLMKKREKVDSIRNQIMEAHLHISDLSHDLDIMKKDSNRYLSEHDQFILDNKKRNDRVSQIRMLNEEDVKQVNELSLSLTSKKEKQEENQKVITDLENNLSDIQIKLNDLLKQIDTLHTSITRDNESLHKIELSCSKTENDLKTLQEKIWSTYELTYGGAEEYRITDFHESNAEKKSKDLISNIHSLGNINIHAIEEYTETKARFDELETQQNDLKKAENNIRQLIQELIEQMETTFVSNFVLLKKYFRETFIRLFGGGDAKIELTDPDDPLNCGIEINVQPPGKKLQLLSLLSGGERALTAIAILFAMLKLKPTPFCILDEIEAALDDANIGYYADYLKEYSHETQFIVVTHRKGTMERCNSLFGVSMEEQGVSRMVSVSLHDYDDE